MAKGPAAAIGVIGKVIELTSPPRPAVEVLTEIALIEAWFDSPEEAREAAERWESSFISRLRRDLSEANRLGRFCQFDFNSSSTYMIQGSAFIEEGVDSERVKEAKRRRGALAEYMAAVSALSPTEFEALCVGMLAEIGVDAPVLTPRSADEGIDFYGKLALEGRLRRVMALPGFYRRLNVWLVGQAKHYKATQAATPDIRAVVGAIDLAKGKAYSTPRDRYPDLDIHVCDPVFYLFFTTGRISDDGWRLLESSGVIGMDGPMVATFLADHGVAFENGAFQPPMFLAWLAKQK